MDEDLGFKAIYDNGHDNCEILLRQLSCPLIFASYLGELAKLKLLKK